MTSESVTLRHDTTPEAAEAAVWRALRRPGAERVTLNLYGFPTAPLGVILSRLPAGWTPGPVRPDRVVLVHARAAGNGRGLTIGTQNIRHAMSPTAAGHVIDQLVAYGADVIGFQEMGGRPRKEAARRHLAAGGYGYLDGGHTGVAYRKDEWEPVRSASELLSNPRYVGEAGAGKGTTFGRKDAQIEILRNKRTGAQKVIVNVHLVPSIYLAVRSRIHREEMRNLVRIVRKYRKYGPVHVVGDFNANHRQRNGRARMLGLRALGLIPNWELGDPGHVAHGLIDYVWSTRRARSQQIIGTDSDHDAVIVSY